MKLYEKLFEIQTKGIKVAKNATNPFHKSRYATLDQVWDKIGSILKEYQLLVLNEGNSEKEGILLVKTTIVNMENPEEKISSDLSVPLSDPQKTGSAVTYFRRYNLCLLLNIIVEWEDDDGNTASSPKETTEKKKDTARVKITNEAFEGLKKNKQFITDCISAEDLLTKVNKKYILTAPQTEEIKKLYEQTIGEEQSDLPFN
jgi:ERF superfamily.